MFDLINVNANGKYINTLWMLPPQSSFGVEPPLPNFLSDCLSRALGSLMLSEGTGSVFMAHKLNICASRVIGIICQRERGTPVQV